MEEPQNKSELINIAELAARLEEEQGPFFSIVSAMGDGVSVQDLDLRVLYSNDANNERFGDDLVGRHCFEIYEHRDTACDECPLLESLRTGKVTRAIRYGIGKDDRQIIGEIVAAPIRNSRGEVVAGVEVVRDITTQEHDREELEKKTRRLEQLAAVSREISSGLDLGQILKSVVKSTVQLAGADAGTVAILDERRQMITYPFHFNMPPEMAQVEVHTGTGLAWQVMQTGEPLIFNDYPAEPLHVPQFSDAGVHTLLAVPLMIGERRLGTLGLFGMSAEHTFTEEKKDLVLAVARQAALAIDNARLFGEVTDRLRVQQELTRSALSIASGLKLDEVLRQVIRSAAQVVHADAAAMALLDEDRDVVIFPQVFNLPGDFSGILTPRSEGISSGVIDTGQPRIENDYPSAPDKREEFVAAGVRAVASVPLVVGGRSIGAIGVMDTGSGHIFAQEDLDILAIISTQAAVAVENARLYGRLSDSARQLEQRVQERTEALSRMFMESERKSRELEAANLRLREVDRLKSEFLANMSHELRTPLNSIIGFSKLILDGLDGEISDEQRHDIDIVHTNGHELLRLIDDLLNLAKIEAGRVTLFREPVVCGDLVRDVVTSLGATASEKGLSLVIDLADDIRMIDADIGKLRQILVNLVGNAIKFTEAGTITVAIEQTPSDTVFSVRDSGPGLSPEAMAQIFDRFHQVQPGMAERGGVGLGLTISKRFVEMHGGKIWVESEVGAGSTFLFSIPGRLGPRAETEAPVVGEGEAGSG
ncbi:MAG: PAS domain-containing sensor histidine kinase [Thermoleophilia bacterium]